MRFRVYSNEKCTKAIVDELRKSMKDIEPGERLKEGISTCCLPAHKKICRNQKFKCAWGCKAYYITVEPVKKRGKV